MHAFTEVLVTFLEFTNEFQEVVNVGAFLGVGVEAAGDDFEDAFLLDEAEQTGLELQPVELLAECVLLIGQLADEELEQNQPLLLDVHLAVALVDLAFVLEGAAD